MLTIRMLLTMHSDKLITVLDEKEHKDWVFNFLGAPFMLPPNSKFNYVSENTFMLSAIISKVTGMSMVDYLYPRIFEPLGIEKPFWETDGNGNNAGGWGLYMKSEDIAKFFLEFTVDESCGKCTPCRIGTRRMLEILEKITKGQAEMEDLDRLEELCNHLKTSSLCALGQTAPNPVLSTLRYFREEYIAHIVDKKCPAGVCKDLLHYKIDPDKCKGCTLCARTCPADAIIGKVKEEHMINPEKCVKCGACMEKCRFGAIYKE